MKPVRFFFTAFVASLLLFGTARVSSSGTCIIGAGGSGTEGAPNTMHCVNCDRDVTICYGDYEYCHYTGPWKCEKGPGTPLP